MKFIELIDNPNIISRYKTTDKIDILCDHCGIIYPKKVSLLKRKLKLNHLSNMCSVCGPKNNKTKPRERYTCSNCDKVFFRKPSRMKKSNNSFCSRSCSNSFNNSHSPKRRRKNSSPSCPMCNGKKDYHANFCIRCRKINSLQKQELRTVQDASLNGNARIKFSYIRKLAHKKMEILSVKKECRICGFDICVDLCHIKPIHMFNILDLIKDVNSITNLAYLCPNHHTMLDKHLLSLIH